MRKFRFSQGLPSSFKWLLTILVGLPVGFAESMEERLIGEMEQRLQTSVQELTQDQDFIESEKLPLIRQISSIEEEIRTMESRLINLQEMSRISEQEIELLEQDTADFESQAQYIISILREYTDTFESRLHVVEDQSYLDRLVEIREAIDSSPDPTSSLMMQTLSMGLERLPQVFGGQRIPGRAVLPDGSLTQGTGLLFGPTAYFASSEDTSIAGVLTFQPNSVEPELMPLAPDFAQAITALTTENSGPLPFDATLGKALTVAQERESLVAHIRKGGYVAIVILSLGGIALLLSLIKFWDLRALSLPPLTRLAKIAETARQGQAEEAIQAAEALSGDAGKMLNAGLRDGKGDIARMEEIMLGSILKRKPELERFLPFIAITAAAAPLLGLLGTVVGMIKTFTLITVFGSGDAKALSSGISEALVTTELGLIVAVPALLLHGLFSRRVRSHIAKLEEIATDFLLYYSDPEPAEPLAAESEA